MFRDAGAHRSLAPGWSGYQALEQQEQASREGGQQLAQDQGQGTWWV